MFREVQAIAKELRTLVEDREEIEGDWCSMDLIQPPMFNGKIFGFSVTKIQTFHQCKELIEYQYNIPYDEVRDALVLDFIEEALDEKVLCKVEKARSSQEAWKILEAKFGTKESDM